MEFGTNASSDRSSVSPSLSEPVDDYGNWTDEQWIKEIQTYIKPTYYDWIFIVLYIFVFVCGLGGNFLVCFAVWRNHHLRTVTNYFLVNLACADFMVIFICMPLTLTQDISQSWFLGLVMCKIIIYLQIVSVLVSVLTLTAISLERYMAICHPLSFRVSKSKSRLTITLVWAVSVLSAVPELVFLTLFPDDMIPSHINWLTKCKPRDDNEELWYQLCLTILFYVVPLIVMGFAYVRIAFCLWKSTVAGPVASNVSAENTASTLRTRKRTAKMLIIVVVLFFVCYLPVYILNILRYTRVLDTLSVVSVENFSLGSRWLCYFNSAVNPVIYNFMSEKFKKEFKIAFTCCKTKWIRVRNRRLYYDDQSEPPIIGKHGNRLKTFGDNKDITVTTEMRTETTRHKSCNYHQIPPGRNTTM